MTRLSNLALFSFVILATASAETHLLRVKPEDGLGKEGFYSVEKGVKCEGGFKAEGAGKKCEGGMKSEFGMKKADEIVNEIATVLSEQLQDFMPSKEGLIPMDGEMEAMKMFDDIETLEDVEDGFSKTVEFGGFVKASWGCKITYEKKGGKFSKKSECGFSGMDGMGPKKPEMEKEFPSFV